MKRALVILTAMGLFLPLAGPTLAKVSVPKSACFSLGINDVDHDKLILGFKMTSTVNTKDGPVKFYTIVGEQHSLSHYSLPVSGTGHVTGNIFHFSISGSTTFTGQPYTFFTEVKWNLTATPPDAVGTWNQRWMETPPSQVIYLDKSLYLIDCTAEQIPY